MLRPLRLSFSSSPLLSKTSFSLHHLSSSSSTPLTTSSNKNVSPPLTKTTNKDASPPAPTLFIPPGLETQQVIITPSMVLPGSNIILGPYASRDDSKVKTVEFVKSSAKARDCPKDALRRPEFAVLGRSNVGKSSLINALVRKKDVALTSKKPGKTQLINHFLINKSWYLVDLPGYGFAHSSRTEKADWSSFTKGYFLNRDSLVSVLLLVDSGVPPQQIDLDCANWLGRNNIGMTIVFTKCDKSKGGKGKRPEENLQKFQGLLSKYYAEPPAWIMTSSVTGFGRDELLLHISQLRNYWNDQEST